MSEPRIVSQMKAPVRVDYRVHAGDVTASFLTNVMAGRLVGRRCPRCAKVYIPVRSICPTCAEPCTEEVPVGPNGTVTTFSVVRFPFEGQRMEPPYACAHVLLDGAHVPLLHIVGGCPVEEVRMGLRVEPVWASPPVASLASVLWFRPSGQPDATYESYREHV